MKRTLIFILAAALSLQNSFSLFAETAPLTPEQFAQTTPTRTFDPDAPTTPAPDETALESPFESQGWTAWGEPLAKVTAEDEKWEETSLVQGHTYFVSAAGSDTSDGSENNPFKTVKKAVSMLRPGDTLYIGEGTYHESVNFTQSGRSDAWITVRGFGNVVFDGGTSLTTLPAFDTKGQDFIRFQNLTVTNMRAAVEVSAGSDHIEIDGLRTDKNRFAVRINESTNITVRNAYADNSKNAFRAYGNSRNLLFENITALSSKDIYEGMSETYRNGDGFIFELEVSNVTLRNIVSANHWDAGFDIKASNVLVENVVTYGNKNNLKIWGKNVVIRNSLSFGAVRQLRPDGSFVEGNGITMEIGGSAKLINVTLADNGHREIEMYENSTLILENSIVARHSAAGVMFHSNTGAVFSSSNSLWFNTAAPAKPVNEMGAEDLWADPLFADWTKRNYQLLAASPAIDRVQPSSNSTPEDLIGNLRTWGDQTDLGAYEFQGTLAQNPIPSFGPGPAPVVPPAPVPTEPSEPAPAPSPNPGKPPKPAPVPFDGILLGLTEGQTLAGIALIQPDPDDTVNLKDVTYYIDGKKTSQTSSKPYTMGGKKGFDTKKLKKGEHTMKAVYRSKDGSEKFLEVKFNI